MKKRFYIAITVIVVGLIGIGAVLYMNSTEESLDIRDEAATSEVLAFPEAEGFGAQTPGGRGGQVIEVTNLNDSGPGSLRAAIDTTGKRIIVFRVSGTIYLNDNLHIKEPFVTIAGQTAPGDGITIANEVLKVEDTHDVIIRYIRSRLGDNNCPSQDDAISIHHSQNIILDHVSASWSIDETLSVTGDESKDITVQWSIISESLNSSCHPKSTAHGYASIIAQKMTNNNGVSFYHNLIAHHTSRNPRLSGRENAQPGPIIDFRNNVIYNWQDRPGYSVDDEYLNVNYIGNYIKPGPSTQKNHNYAIVNTGPRLNLYIDSNYHTLKGYKDWNLIKGNASKSNQSFPAPNVVTFNAEENYNKVLADAGCTLPKRDAVDVRIINDVKNGTGRIINSQNDVGGWPSLNSTTPPTDSDHDGMPDTWENEYGFNPNDSSDNSQDADDDGYTNIEEYLNNTIPIVTPPPCIPNCSDKECGDDGCGGSCGSCSSGENCISGSCMSSELDCSNADVNGPDLKPDGEITMLDIAVVLTNFKWQKNPRNEKADISGPDLEPDGEVNMQDVSKVLACFRMN
jgi:pectate lyase